MERPLRLVAANPLDRLARTLEALLVVASQPLSVADLSEAAGEDAERVETALGLLGRAVPGRAQRDRPREGRRRVGISRLTGGSRGLRTAVRAAGRARALGRGARDAGGDRLPGAVLPAGDRAAARRRRRLGRGGARRARADRGSRTRRAVGAVRYRVTPLFERIFGLESLSELPRLDDLGGDAEEIRGRLETIAELPVAQPRQACRSLRGGDLVFLARLETGPDARQKGWRSSSRTSPLDLVGVNSSARSSGRGTRRGGADRQASTVAMCGSPRRR